MNKRLDPTLTEAPREDCYGFYGTLRLNSMYEDGETGLTDVDLDHQWEEATHELAIIFKEHSPTVLRNFLRSSYGRHLADEVSSQSQGRDRTAINLTQALLRAVYRTKTMRCGKVRSIWAKGFDEVRAATLAGTWN